MSDGRPEAPLRGGDERRKDEDMRPTIRVTGVGRINRFTFVPSPHAFGLRIGSHVTRLISSSSNMRHERR